MGRKGRKTYAPAMLNILPKLELVPINRYFITLPKALRPSRISLCKTCKLFSSRIIEAASLATSTPVETEMPTSAVCNEGASFAVAHIAHDVLAVLECENDTVFLSG